MKNIVFIVSILLVIILYTYSSGESMEYWESKDVSLFLVDGFIVRVFIGGDTEDLMINSDVLKSKIELELRKNEIEVYKDNDDYYDNYPMKNMVYLTLNVRLIQTKYESGEKIGNIVYKSNLFVDEFTEITRLKDSVYFKHLPRNISTTWENGVFGIIDRDGIYQTINDFLEDTMSIFLNDYYKMNSEDYIDWLNKREKYFDSLDTIYDSK